MTKPFATTTLLGLLLFGMITVATPSLSRLCSDEVATRRRAGTSPRSPPTEPARSPL